MTSPAIEKSQDQCKCFVSFDSIQQKILYLKSKIFTCTLFIVLLVRRNDVLLLLGPPSPLGILFRNCRNHEMKSETRATEIEVYPITRSSQITRLRFERTGIGIRMVNRRRRWVWRNWERKNDLQFLVLTDFFFLYFTCKSLWAVLARVLMSSLFVKKFKLKWKLVTSARIAHYLTLWDKLLYC